MSHSLSSFLQRMQRVGGGASLAAVAGLVGVVSVPCVEAFALRANERDARTALRLLDAALERRLATEAEGAPDALPDVWAGDREVRHRLNDARVVREDLLLYHGYFLAWTERGDGRGELVAWPRLPGATGRVAYALDASGNLRRTEHRP